ncbi:MAG: hypothetical protein ACYCUM_10515 [Solirubrobacteraceae bacterium]
MKGIRYVGVLSAVLVVMLSAGVSAAFGSEFKTAKFPVTVTGHGTNPHFVSESGNTVTCEESNSEGELKSATEGHVTVTYSGKCELKATTPVTINEACPTITTEDLKVQPGSNLDGPVVGSTTKTGLYFSPNSGTVMAKFTCGSVAVTVTGSLVCESEPIGKESTTGTVICKEDGATGEQEFTSAELPNGELVEEGHLTAESTAFGGLFKSTERDAQNTTEALEFGAPVEQTA